VAALVVLLLQFPARLFREAQLLRPVPLPPEQQEVAAVAPSLVQGLVASENLRRRLPFSASTARISPSAV
jgi:hypothetical protein